MQQEASRKLGFAARRTMKAAQELYEGVEVEGIGAIGLITYMRTDSLRISEDARKEGNDFIRETYGADYLPAKPRQFKSRNNAQDAHEAIRPSMPSLTPVSYTQLILFIVSKAARLSMVLQIQNIPCGDAVSPKWRDISSEISTYAASAPLPRRMACSCSPYPSRARAVTSTVRIATPCLLYTSAGRAESLNASMAAGIILWELMRPQE